MSEKHPYIVYSKELDFSLSMAQYCIDNNYNPDEFMMLLEEWCKFSDRFESGRIRRMLFVDDYPFMQIVEFRFTHLQSGESYSCTTMRPKL